MNKKEFKDWCDRTGYITTNDWNYQSIKGRDHYFIINPKTDKFALISFDPKNVDYQVMVSDWTDFNEYAEKFHQETFKLEPARENVPIEVTVGVGNNRWLEK